MKAQKAPWIIGVLLLAACTNAFAADASVVVPLDPESLSWTAPVRVVRDADALGETYVVLSARRAGESAGSASVQLPRAGDYYVWGRVRAAKGAGRSFDVELGGVRRAWSIAAPSEWHWERVARANRSGAATPVVLSVKRPGAYTFRVLAREDGASIDEFLITDDLYLSPVDHPQR